MRFITSGSIIAITYFAVSASAFPRPQPAASYLVVNVAGPSISEEASIVYETVKETTTSRESTPITTTPPSNTSTIIIYTSTKEVTITISPLSSTSCSSLSTSASSSSATYNTVPAPYVAATTAAVAWNSTMTTISGPTGTASTYSTATPCVGDDRPDGLSSRFAPQI